MIALVLGATGATGKDLIEKLSADAAFKKIYAFVRRPVDFKNEKVTVNVVDFDQPESWKNLVKGDVAFSCLGTTLKDAGSKEAQKIVDFNYQYSFAQAARQNNVEDFVLVSSYGADSKSKIFYSRMKGELEDAVRALHFQKLTIFNPGMLERKDSERPGEVLGGKIIRFANKLGILESQKPLPTEVLAQAMVNSSKIKSKGNANIKLGAIFSFAQKNN